MKLTLKLTLLTALTGLSFSSASYARGMSGNYEENTMVANGQGVSSPSFWGGISGQNPAGLIENMGFKLQGAAATFDDSTKNLRESGGLFLGNGTLAAGGEYSTFNQGAYPTGENQINFGIAARLDAVRTTLGVSGHTVSNGGGSSFDIGMLMELAPQLRLGAMIPDVTHGLHTIGGGFTFLADQMVDFVVDAGYQIQNKEGIVKPGISIHTNIIQATASYGFRFAGMADSALVTTKFTAGLGLKLAQRFFVEYEYRVLPEHRLGLTLRFN
jgi:hypothetical protein